MRWQFDLNGVKDGDTIKITNELLDTVERATERADAEFLEVGYDKRIISFVTTRLDLTLNGVYNISGKPYIIKSLQYSIDASILCTVTCERYE